MRTISLATSLVILVALGAAFPAAAADETPERISRQCVTSAPLINYPSLAFRLLGLQLQGRWTLDHGEEMEHDFAPSCAKLADCLELRDNPFMFCDDNFVLDLRPLCDKRFSRETQPQDWEQCRSFVEVYAIDVDSGSADVWRKAQAWSKTQPLDPAQTLDVTVTPDAPLPGVPTKIVVTARDAKSGIPVYGHVRIGGKSFSSKDNPAGTSATLYPFKYAFAFERVKNAEGHFDLVSPEITIETPHYPLVRTTFHTQPPRLVATVKRAGRGRIVVEAKDATTGQPVDATVLAGDVEAGRSNTPMTVRADAAPEIWVRAEGYADTRAEHEVSAKKN